MKLISLILLLTSIELGHCHFKANNEPKLSGIESLAITDKLLVPNLHPKHYHYWLRNHPITYSLFKQLCSQAPPLDQIKDLTQFQALHLNFTFEDETYLTNLNHGKLLLKNICKDIDEVPKLCWGYENNCQNIYAMPECYGSSFGQAKNEQEHKILWFNQADFGYILERRREFNRFCIPDKQLDADIKSSFDCTKNFKSCRGQNLILDLKKSVKLESSESDSNLIGPGQIGGWNCDLQTKRIPEENGQQGALQSWYSDLKHYQLMNSLAPEKSCDLNLDKQVYFVKLDSFSNLYHYMCTFFNLYASMHLHNRFFEDNQIIFWTENKPLNSRFESMWSVFSKNEPTSIGEYRGKRLCIDRFIFALPPRMIEGLYYNTPLVSGCTKTGLFDAFSKHVLHKLGIQSDYTPKLHKNTNNDLVRILLISRSTPARKVLNELELREKLKERGYQLDVIDYVNIEFIESIKKTANTDILIGMHGAGLTNLLFLPDWASVIELHDCGDKAYHELSRLRGLAYFTLINTSEKQPVTKVEPDDRIIDSAQDDKFSNYKIDPEALDELVVKAATRTKRIRAKQFVEQNNVDDLELGVSHDEL